MGKNYLTVSKLQCVAIEWFSIEHSDWFGFNFKTLT